jgi:hypothetical protein
MSIRREMAEGAQPMDEDGNFLPDYPPGERPVWANWWGTPGVDSGRPRSPAPEQAAEEPPRKNPGKLTDKA